MIYIGVYPFNSQVYRYPTYLDDSILRPIATTVFSVTLITILRPEFGWLIYPLFVDFILRYLHPKFSPLVHVTRLIAVNILKNEPLPKFSQPKRFAILIGIIISGMISIGRITGIDIIVLSGSVLLLFASFLQGFYNYCIGCKLFDFFVKIGLLRKNKPISTDKLNPVNIK